jgi:hypothetical protein
LRLFDAESSAVIAWIVLAGFDVGFVFDVVDLAFGCFRRRKDRLR